MNNAGRLPSRRESLSDRYERSPIIRTLVAIIGQAIPVASVADATLVAKIVEMREARARAFFDELETQNIVLTDEQVRNDAFLHAYFATMRAALNTRRHEKIRLFARLFSGYSQSKHVNDVDDYEEMLEILDDLSIREFQILLLLHKFETSAPIRQDQNPLQRVLTYWEAFIASVESQFGIPASEIPGVLARMRRTGLYDNIYGTYYDYTGDKGCLTPNYAVFLDAVRTNNSETP